MCFVLKGAAGICCNPLVLQKAKKSKQKKDDVTFLTCP